MSLKRGEKDRETKKEHHLFLFKSSSSLHLFSHVHMFSLSISDLSRVNVGTRFPLSRPLPNTYDAIRPEIHSCSLFEPQQELVGVSVPCGCRAPVGSLRGQPLNKVGQSKTLVPLTQVGQEAIAHHWLLLDKLRQGAREIL